MAEPEWLQFVPRYPKTTHPLQLDERSWAITPVHELPAANDCERRINALRYLQALYHIARILWVPASFTVSKEDADQMSASHGRFIELIDRGFSDLAKTGFVIPDHWLAVYPIGSFGVRMNNTANGMTSFVTLDKPDYVAVDRIVTDYATAIRRFQIELSTLPEKKSTQGKPGRKPLKTKDPIRYRNYETWAKAWKTGKYKDYADCASDFGGETTAKDIQMAVDYFRNQSKR